MRPGESSAEETFYDRVGGHDTFAAMIHTFFDGVRSDPDLRAMYPATDLPGAENRLLMFFEQYWGGPTDYSRTRGAPMLKMRHMPYRITGTMKDKWLLAMHRAITSVELPPEEDAEMRAYVERAGTYLINADE